MNQLANQNEQVPTTLTPVEYIEQFKALYYLIKSKRDTEIIILDKIKTFKKCDLVQINERIKEKLRLHNVLTFTQSITVSLSNKEFKTFGSWDSFMIFNWDVSDTTQYISLEWDFNVLLPNQQNQIPQTHTLRLRLGREIRPNEMIQVIFQGGGETEIEEATAQAVCKIDFVNAMICDELKSLVSKWYEALTNNSEDHKVVQFINNNSAKIREFIILLFLTFCSILLNFGTSCFDLTHADLIKTIYLLATISIIAFYISYKSGVLYSNRVIRLTIEKFRRSPIFEFTSGDLNKIKDVSKQNNKLIKELLIKILVTIIVNVLAFGGGKLLTIFINN